MNYTLGYVNGFFAALQLVAGVFVAWRIFFCTEYPKKYKDPGICIGPVFVLGLLVTLFIICFGMVDMAYLSVTQHLRISDREIAGAQLQHWKLYASAYAVTIIALMLNVRREDIPWNKLRRKRRPGLHLVVSNI